MREVAHWLVIHAQDALQSLGILGGLAFTAFSLRADTRSRRLQTLITLTKQHREIWEDVTKLPALRRVIDPTANLRQHPVTPEEARFITFVVLHIHC